MASLQDMPPELLLTSADHLTGDDLKSLVLVSKQLNGTLQHRMHQKLVWECCLDYPLEKSIEPGEVIVRNGERFCSKVKADKGFANSITHLSISSNRCAGHSWLLDDPNKHTGPMEGEQMTWDVIGRMAGLTSLSVRGDQSRTLANASLPQGLRHLHIGCMPPEVTWKVAQWIFNLRQTNIRSLVMEEIDFCTTGDELQKITSGAIPPTSSFHDGPHLESIVMKEVCMRSAEFEILLERCQGLKRLSYVVPSLARFQECSDQMNPQQFSMALGSLKESLEELMVTGFTFQSWTLNKFPGVHNSLGGFQRLRKLTIDPGVLVGYRTCRYKAATARNHLRDLSEFAMMLPEALEELGLTINAEQVQRVRWYRETILASIVIARIERRRLQNLAIIRIFNFRTFSPCLTCSCAADCSTEQDPRNKYNLDMLVEEVMPFRYLPAVWKKQGIKMECYYWDLNPMGISARDLDAWLLGLCVTPGLGRDVWPAR